MEPTQVKTMASVREIGTLRLKLRDDLQINMDATATRSQVLVEDSRRSRFYRLGCAEYEFVSLLDGERTLEEVHQSLVQQGSTETLSWQEALALTKWLADMELLDVPPEACPSQNPVNKSRAEGNGQRNPLVFKLRLPTSDHCIHVLNQGLGWCFSPRFTLLMAMVIAVAMVNLISHGDQFYAAWQGVFAVDNWFWLAACWVFLKVVHELAHAMVCVRYGGNIQETGILFVLFAPLPYVDVSASWRFGSKYQRMHVALAGMYAELCIAAVAAITFCEVSDAATKHVLANLVMTASVTTLLFNANPLMRFDGYFLLSDWLGISNLSTNGQRYVRAWIERNVLGLSVALPQWSGEANYWIRSYGWAAWLWKFLVAGSMVAIAATWWGGSNIVMALLVAVGMFGVPVFQFGKLLVQGRGREQPKRLRFAVLLVAFLAVGVVPLWLVPWAMGCRVAAVVDYSPSTVMRASESGFVREVHVVASQKVDPGVLLLVLENREAQAEVENLKFQVQQSEIRARQYEQKKQWAAQQAEQQQRAALLTELHEKEARVAGYRVLAPHEGRIIHRDPQQLLGKYCEAGEELFVIGDETKKELRAFIPQDLAGHFEQQLGEEVTVRLPDQTEMVGRLEKLIPRATVDLKYAGLGAIHGGSLPVKRVSTTSSDSPRWELTQPHIEAIVRISPDDGEQLFAGQRVMVVCQAEKRTAAEHMLAVLQDLMRYLFDLA